MKLILLLFNAVDKYTAFLFFVSSAWLSLSFNSAAVLIFLRMPMCRKADAASSNCGKALLQESVEMWLPLLLILWIYKSAPPKFSLLPNMVSQAHGDCHFKGLSAIAAFTIDRRLYTLWAALDLPRRLWMDIWTAKANWLTCQAEETTLKRQERHCLALLETSNLSTLQLR